MDTKEPVMRARLLGGFTLAFLISWSAAAFRPAAADDLRFAITFGAAQSREPLDGRVLLMI